LPGSISKAGAPSAAQMAPVGGVADERLVALLQLAFEPLDDGLPVGAVLLGLGLVAADDVADALDDDLLGEELGFPVLAVHEQGREGFGVVEHHLAHALVGALAHAEDVFEAARFERGDGRPGDHAAIGDHADAANAEAVAQAVDDGDEHGDVGGVCRRHLGADRPPLAIDHDGEDHLREIGAVVLGVAARPERGAAGTFEGERGRVHEHDAEIGEEVAPSGEQRLLQAVLDAARCEGRGVGLPGLGQLLPEPGHGAVEMVQRQAIRARDGVVLHPMDAGAVRARGHQPVQHRHEQGPLDVELEATPGEVRLHDRGAAGLLPQPPEQDRRADAADRQQIGRASCRERV